MSGFEIELGDGKIGLDHTGMLWFDSCCDGGNVQLTLADAARLRQTLNAFTSFREGLKREAQ